MIVIVVPDFFYRNIYRFGRVAVFDCESIAAACHGDGVSRHLRCFADFINHLDAGFVFIKSCKAIGPAVCLIQNGGADDNTVGIQVYLDCSGTDAVLVILIVPDLLYGNGNLARCMGVFNRKGNTG